MNLPDLRTFSDEWVMGYADAFNAVALYIDDDMPRLSQLMTWVHGDDRRAASFMFATTSLASRIGGIDRVGWGKGLLAARAEMANRGIST